MDIALAPPADRREWPALLAALSCRVEANIARIDECIEAVNEALEASSATSTETPPQHCRDAIVTRDGQYYLKTHRRVKVKKHKRTRVERP